MSDEDAIRAAVGGIVDAGQLAGAAMLVWRKGRIEQAVCVGTRDLDSGAPVERDTIFRIASMTKPVTTVAALALMDKGRFGLDDPVDRWAPEFAAMRVLRARGGPVDDTVAAGRAITFRDLLTQRAGFTYGDFESGPIGAAYAALGGDIDSALTPDEWIRTLASLPLIDQPGRVFHYGHATDLLGLLVARIADAPLGDVLRQHIFDPLGMVDTGFTVPANKADRRAAPHGFDADGRLTRRATVPGGHALPERPDDMTFVSGGQGLWSTADDYLAFARMFVPSGAQRVLRPETLALMVSNQLIADQRAGSEMFGLPIFAEGHGFGMGVALVMEPERADTTLCGGNAGSMGWPGAYGGWWRADPLDDSVLIFLSHNMVELDQLAAGVGLGVFSAIAQFQALAASSQ